MRIASACFISCAILQLPAIDIVDAGASLNIGFDLQTRIEATRARSPTGGAYDPADGSTSRPDDVDGYLRRARISFKGTIDRQWSADMILAADNAERGALGASRTPSLLLATVSWNHSEEGRSHRLQAGLDYPFYNRASFGPSTAMLMPGDRATLLLLWPRSFGVGYRYRNATTRFGIDIQQNSNSAFPSYPAATNAPALAGDSTNGQRGEGLCYTTRLEWSPPGLALGDWKESFAGDAGTGLGFGVDLGFNDRDRVAYGGAMPNASVNTLCYGAEMNFHSDGFSSILDARWQKVRTTGDDGTFVTGPDRSIDSVVYVAQAGYAMAAGSRGWRIEPALRLSRIDTDTANDHETNAFGTNDHGLSGWEYEAGLNWYLRGHANKIQLSVTRWQAESGSAAAMIYRLQHQFVF